MFVFATCHVLPVTLICWDTRLSVIYHAASLLVPCRLASLRHFILTVSGSCLLSFSSCAKNWIWSSKDPVKGVAVLYIGIGAFEVSTIKFTFLSENKGPWFQMNKSYFPILIFFAIIKDKCSKNVALSILLLYKGATSTRVITQPSSASRFNNWNQKN